MKSKRAKACDIPARVKKKVMERDGGACVICGNHQNVMPNAHYIPRSKGGLGIEQNIVTLCTNFTEHCCHDRFDNGTAEERGELREKIAAYLSSKYPGWNPDKLVFQKIPEEVPELSISIRIAIYGRVRVMQESELNGAWEYCEEGRTVKSSRVQTGGRVYRHPKTGEIVFLPYSEGRAAVMQYAKEYQDGTLYA